MSHNQALLWWTRWGLRRPRGRGGPGGLEAVIRGGDGESAAAPAVGGRGGLGGSAGGQLRRHVNAVSAITWSRIPCRHLESEHSRQMKTSDRSRHGGKIAVQMAHDAADLLA